MNDIGAMPGRVFAYSAAFHVVVAVMLYGLIHWHIFDREIEEAPLALGMKLVHRLIRRHSCGIPGIHAS